MSNTWVVRLERKGNVVAEISGYIDPFRELISETGTDKAHVGCTYKRALQSYGGEALSFSVNVTCDQNQVTIDRAGELSMLKVIEMLGHGTELLARLEEEARKVG
jgi:hypothetical protein